MLKEKNACAFFPEICLILEKGDLKLNNWIDLIFRSHQRVEKAKENKNIFKVQSYERMIKIDDITGPDSRYSLMRLFEIAITSLKFFR